MNEIYKNIENDTNNLEKDIKDLDNKVEDVPDFNKYYKELEDIHNKFNKLENDINSIKDLNKKEEFKKRLDDLKIMMLDLISDWNIDDFINWKTKDTAIDKKVQNVNQFFHNNMTILIENSRQINWEFKIITKDNLVSVLQTLNIPYQIVNYKWLNTPIFTDSIWNIYIWDEKWEIRICLPEEILWWSAWWNSNNKNIAIKDSKKFKPNKLSWIEKTVEVSRKLPWWFNTSFSIKYDDYKRAPWLSTSYKSWNFWMGAYVSPWFITKGDNKYKWNLWHKTKIPLNSNKIEVKNTVSLTATEKNEGPWSQKLGIESTLTYYYKKIYKFYLRGNISGDLSKKDLLTQFKDSVNLELGVKRDI